MMARHGDRMMVMTAMVMIMLVAMSKTQVAWSGYKSVAG
jgi:hypothetical protein